MIKEEEIFKPTVKKPVNDQSKNFEKNFKKTMLRQAPQVAPNIRLNEIDSMLSEAEYSLKKKIFSLPKMEALVFADPKLRAVYDEMSVNGEEKYGYHYNETIMNMIFNDYVLNSPKYLQKYKMAIPKEKKRRDKSGINQAKKAGEETMKKTNPTFKPRKLDPSGLPKQEKKSSQLNEEVTKVQFLVNEKDPENPDLFAYFPDNIYNGEYRDCYSHIGQHSSCHPEYAKESRPATPEEYADLKAELEKQVGYELDVVNQANETTSAGGAGGAAGYVGYAAPLGYDKKVDETTSAGSAAGSQSYVGYAGPAAWGSGDLMKSKGKSKVMRKPIFPGGTIIAETNYLTDPSGFEKFAESMDDEIIDKTAAFSSDTVKGWDDADKQIQMDRLKTGQIDKPNLNLVEKATSKAQQRLFGMAHAVQKGELSPSKVGGAVKKIAKTVNPDDVEDFASTKHDDLPEKLGEETQTMIQNNGTSMSNKPTPAGEQGSGVPMGMQATGGMNESNIINASRRDIIKKIQDVSGIIGTSMPSTEFLSQLDDRQLLDLYDEALKNSPSLKSKIVSLLGLHGLYEDEEKGYDYFMAKPEVDDEFVEWMSREFDLNPETVWAVAEIQGNPADTYTAINDEADRKGYGFDKVDNDEYLYERKNNREMKLLEELNKELEAFSVHHNKLKVMAEDKKPSSLVMKDRLGGENEKNFKKDLQHSGTKEIIDVEKELQWKDQQTDVGDDPQKLGQDIEKKVLKVTDGNALKNVGDSANDEGDEIPKRNRTDDEQNDVDMHRLGQQDLVYDNEPGKRFEDRMKADMGDKLYAERQKKLVWRSEAPMYNKDPQPVEDTEVDKDQFNKEKSMWNRRDGIGESVVSGRYYSTLGKRCLIDFRLNETLEIVNEKDSENYSEINVNGLGNVYDNKGEINEGVSKVLNKYKFYTDGITVYRFKSPVQNLNEAALKTKPVINEQFEKMKHLTGYKPNNFVDTKNVKKNRGF